MGRMTRASAPRQKVVLLREVGSRSPWRHGPPAFSVPPALGEALRSKREQQIAKACDKELATRALSKEGQKRDC